MKYYLIAGEASGDLHASNLMRALKARDAEAEFRFFGGDLMSAVGGIMVSIIVSWLIWASCKWRSMLVPSCEE